MVKTQTVTIQEPKFLKAADVAEIIGISESTAYRLIRTMNQELKKQGFLTVAGKVSKKYFEQKVCM